LMSNILEIDAIDRKILRLIQQDATLAIQEIGRQVGLSANPCWRRIKRMEEAGLIERRVALLDPARLGLGLTSFVAIRTSNHSAQWLDAFAKGIGDIPEIIECHRMSGDTDYLLKVVVADIRDYDRVYKALIGCVPGISDVSSAFSMERLKYGTALPV
jgi:Lrp/AsnC family transcriptional regulator